MNDKKILPDEGLLEDELYHQLSEACKEGYKKTLEAEVDFIRFNERDKESLKILNELYKKYTDLLFNEWANH